MLQVAEQDRQTGGSVSLPVVHSGGTPGPWYMYCPSVQTHFSHLLALGQGPATTVLDPGLQMQSVSLMACFKNMVRFESWSHMFKAWT